MKETELGEQVITWLKEERPHWEIFQEIRPGKYTGGSIADIICLNSLDEVWVIELKTTLNLAVIRQTYTWETDYRSIAVVAAKRTASKDERRWWYKYLHFDMDIGTIVANEFGRTQEVYEPPKRELKFDMTNKKLIEICRSGKTEGFGQAGGQGGGHWTPYKETMKSVREYIEKHPGCGAGDIVSALGKMHYANAHSARTNLVKNLEFVENDWCEVKQKGTYLTFYVKEGK